MNLIEVSRTDYDYKTRANLPEGWEDFDEVPVGSIARDADTGQPLVIYGLLGMVDTATWANLRQELKSVHWDDDTQTGTSQARLSGIRNPFKTFGFSEPAPLRRRYGCSRCRFTAD